MSVLVNDYGLVLILVLRFMTLYTKELVSVVVNKLEHDLSFIDILCVAWIGGT